jgi:hypothetical protein
LERDQAVALLKEIIAQDLAQPTAVYVREYKGQPSSFHVALKK